MRTCKNRRFNEIRQMR